MRNLVISSVSVRAVKPNRPFTEVSITRDLLNDVEYVLSSDGSLFIFAHGALSQTVALLTPEVTADDWFNAEYVQDINCVICISHSGIIASVNVSTLTIEEEGRVEGGIRCCAWSPDLSRLLLVTDDNSMVMLSSFFDCIREIPFPRRPDSPSIVSWRGDAQSFAVFFIPANCEEGQVQIFSPDLELFAVGKNIAEGTEERFLQGLKPAMAVAPNGSLIAIAQQMPRRKLQVCFIENNGLRHGDFDIHCPELADESFWSVDALEWDTTSTLLGINLSTEVKNETIRKIQIYTRGNYHWYLKLELNDVSIISFDKETAGRIHLLRIAEEDAMIHVADLVWDTCVSSTQDGSTAVIDGKLILLTPLGIACIPPPMSRFQVELQYPCRSVCFWKSFDEKHSCLGCLAGDRLLQLFNINSIGMPTHLCNIEINELTETKTLLLKALVIFQSFRSDLWVGITCLRYFHDRAVDSIMIIQVGSMGQVNKFAEIALRGVSTAICCIGSDCSMHFGVGIVSEDSTFAVWKFSTDILDDPPVKTSSFPEPCYSLRCLNEGKDEEGSVLIGLSSRNRLYCGEALIFHAVSSYAYNRGLNVLLYVSLGTKPQLVVLPCDALSPETLLDFNRERDLTDQQDSRPIER